MPLYRAELLAKKPLRYAALIHDVSQVLHLPFDYDDGSYARDRSGYNNHGVVYGATKADGKIGMARSLDGVDDYMKVPDDPSLRLSKEFTVMLWVNAYSSPGANPIVILKGISDPRYVNYAILQSTGNSFRAYVARYDSTTSATVSFGTLPLMEWHLLTMTFTTSQLAVYVDGSLKGSVATGWEAYKSADDILLGYTWGYWFNGGMDEVRIFDRLLSVDEICMFMYRRW